MPAFANEISLMPLWYRSVSAKKFCATLSDMRLLSFEQDTVLDTSNYWIFLGLMVGKYSPSILSMIFLTCLFGLEVVILMTSKLQVCIYVSLLRPTLEKKSNTSLKWSSKKPGFALRSSSQLFMLISKCLTLLYISLFFTGFDIAFRMRSSRLQLLVI